MSDSADLFEAVSHPTRIRILKLLEKKPSSFASLKRELNIESSGNLDYHIKKLGKLVAVQRDGLYALTDDGREALTSVRAIEAWKELERQKMKVRADMPREAYLLSFLVLSVGFLALFCVFWLTLNWRSWDLTLGLFEFVYFVVSVTSFVSFYDLWRVRGSGWALAVVQGALVLLSTVFPLCLARYLWGIHLSLGILLTVLVLLDVGVLYFAFRRVVRDFYGRLYADSMPRRVMVGALFGVFIGLLELFSANLIVYADFLVGKIGWGPGGAGVAFLYYFSIPIGLFIALGGVLILVRKYVTGGIMLLILGVTHLPTSSVIVVYLLLGLPYPATTIVLQAVMWSLSLALFVLPIVGGILAVTAKSRAPFK